MREYGTPCTRVSIKINTVEINSSRERSTIASPSTTAFQKKGSLRRARGIARGRQVVRAAYDSVVGRASIVAGEGGVDECCVSRGQ